MKRVLVSAVVVCLVLSACGGQATPDPTKVAHLVDQAVKATVAAMPTPEPQTIEKFVKETVIVEKPVRETVIVATPTSAEGDELLGVWVDIADPDLYAIVKRSGDLYIWEDNDPYHVMGGCLGVYENGMLHLTGQYGAPMAYYDEETGYMVFALPMQAFLNAKTV